MHLENHTIILLLREILHKLNRIERKLTPHHTNHAKIAFGGIMQSGPGTQAIGSTLKATFVPIEADGATQTPGAKLTTPPVFAVSDTTIATIVDNGDGTATITGIAAGTVTVTATGGVFTDSDGTVSAPLTASNNDTIGSGNPTGRTVSAEIYFG